MGWRLNVKPRATARQEPQIFTQEKSWVDAVIVRLVEETDLPAMEWDGQYSHFRRVYAEAYHRQQRGLSLLWVAELPGTGLVGQVFIQITCDRPELADGEERAYLYSFRVRDGYRDHGLGSRIMDIVENDLRMRGFSYVTLNVARDNPRAQQLYVRRGYRVIAPEPGVWSYPDEKGVWHRVEEPAWRMEKEL